MSDSGGDSSGSSTSYDQTVSSPGFGGSYSGVTSPLVAAMLTAPHGYGSAAFLAKSAVFAEMGAAANSDANWFAPGGSWGGSATHSDTNTGGSNSSNGTNANSGQTAASGTIQYFPLAAGLVLGQTPATGNRATGTTGGASESYDQYAWRMRERLGFMSREEWEAEQARRAFERLPAAERANILRALDAFHSRSNLPCRNGACIINLGDQKAVIFYREVPVGENVLTLGGVQRAQTVRIPERVGFFGADMSDERIFQMLTVRDELNDSAAHYFGHEATWIPLWGTAIRIENGEWGLAILSFTDDVGWVTVVYSAAGRLMAVRGRTLANTTRGWRVGQPINNLTSAGNVPSWDAVRQRFWRNEALNNPGNYSEANLGRMREGLAPQRLNPRTGQLESKELHHIPPQREGGLFDVEPLWPDEHAAVDPFRRTGR